MARFTFTINGIIIDYSGATLVDFGSQVLRDGLFVEVESDSMIIGNVLEADKIELEEITKLDEGSKAKIEGQITRFNSSSPITFFKSRSAIKILPGSNLPL